MKNKKTHRLVWIESWLVEAVLDSPLTQGIYGINKKVNYVIKDWLSPESQEPPEDGSGSMSCENVTLTTFNTKTGLYETSGA